MKDLDKLKHFDTAEKLVDILMEKTQSNNPTFFRILVAYYFAKISATMRVSIKTHDRGEIPVSLYAMNFANSGHGKGHSTNIMEEQVIFEFKNRFISSIFPTVSAKSLAILATKRSTRNGNDPDDELAACEKEFESLGNLAFSFDSATTAAVKQMRQKLLMSGAGAVNFEMDEVGSNLLGNIEVLSTFLELFDVGKVKQKLTKNTNENKRSEEIDGRTPANMLLFGTPDRVLDGGKTEEELLNSFSSGYARRCFFGIANDSNKDEGISAEELYDKLTSSTSSQYMDDIAIDLGMLADLKYFNTTLTMTKSVSILLIEYKLHCEKLARGMKKHEELFKAEISHRYYKVLKLAGAYAFIHTSKSVTEDHIYSAIKLAEESGKDFKEIITREPNYVKLAHYIADIGKEVTHVDLIEDLPFYRGAEAQKRDMLALAIAYGYKNNIIIKKTYTEGIEFLKGESMDVTNLDEVTISYSKHITEGYIPAVVKFSELTKAINATGYEYTAHAFLNKYRHSDNVIQGFNLVMLDVDEGMSIDTVKLLLADYQYLIATTKRHTAEKNRFRIILPLSHTVKLNTELYKQFMENVFDWLPFTVDTATKDIARKWSSHNGETFNNEGKLLDAMLFIPETKRNDEQTKRVLDTRAMNNLERWFLFNTRDGNRSNQLIRYAYALVDNGKDVEQIRHSVMAFNKKLKDKLSEEEITNTIMVTVIKAVVKRNQ